MRAQSVTELWLNKVPSQENDYEDEKDEYDLYDDTDVEGSVLPLSVAISPCQAVKA